ncbi:hypothetical protein V4F39_20430 [Aquincola sp. MAHUQ-54]|uniref:Uncharacterized protein n=1 Tax=Aquincola agrisoli TaxID=3119538 RepID=A0AAW9QJI6_9BURK
MARTLFASLRLINDEERIVMVLRINIEGATEEEVARGIAAAKAHLAFRGFDPAEAAASCVKRDRWSGNGFRGAEPTDREMQAADAWDEADRIAAAACCEGWRAAPFCSDLETDVPQEADASTGRAA